MDTTSPCCWSSTYTEIQIFDVMVFVRYNEAYNLCGVVY